MSWCSECHLHLLIKHAVLTLSLYIYHLKLPQSSLFYFSLLLPVNSPSIPQDRLAVIHEFNRHEDSYEAGIKLRCSMDCCHEHIKEHVVLLTANPDPLLLGGSLNWFCWEVKVPSLEGWLFHSSLLMPALTLATQSSQINKYGVIYIREILRFSHYIRRPSLSPFPALV